MKNITIATRTVQTENGFHAEYAVTVKDDYLDDETHPMVSRFKRAIATTRKAVTDTLDLITGDDEPYWKSGGTGEREDVLAIRVLIETLSNAAISSAVIVMTSDSAVKGSLYHLPVWRENEFVGTNGHPIKCEALWRQLDELIGKDAFIFYYDYQTSLKDVQEGEGNPPPYSYTNTDPPYIERWDEGEVPAKDE